MNINRITYKDETVVIGYNNKNEVSDSIDAFSMKSREMPLPSFVAAFEQMGTHIALLCDLPEEATPKIHLKSVIISYGEEAVSTILVGTKDVSSAKSGIALKTPKYTYYKEKHAADPGEKKNVMPEDVYLDLSTLAKEAYAYIQGQRAQLDLFDKNPPEESVSDEE